VTDLVTGQHAILEGACVLNLAGCCGNARLPKSRQIAGTLAELRVRFGRQFALPSATLLPVKIRDAQLLAAHAYNLNFATDLIGNSGVAGSSE
jgi:hypothetical protein